MSVSGGANAQEPQNFVCLIANLVLVAVWNRHRVAGADWPRFTLDCHDARAFQNEINLLRERMKMQRRALSGRKRGFGQALVLQRRVACVEKFADLRTVGGDERLNVLAVLDCH